MSLMSLRDFVPGSFPVPQTPVVLSGMGSLRDFVPGSFPVPQTPVVLSGMSSLVPSSPTGLTIQGNSVLSAWQGAGMSGVRGMGCGGKRDDCGCGCGGGMGQLSLTSISAPFTTAFADLQAAISAGSITPLTMTDWAVIGGTVWAAWFLLKKK
jgi:hypothetical protein